MLQQILLDLETAVELIEMLDEAVQYLSEIAIAEINETPGGEIDIKRIRLHVWMISSLVGSACAAGEIVESARCQLKRQEAHKKGG